jgi:hypothetical protein
MGIGSSPEGSKGPGDTQKRGKSSKEPKRDDDETNKIPELQLGKPSASNAAAPLFDDEEESFTIVIDDAEEGLKDTGSVEPDQKADIKDPADPIYHAQTVERRAVDPERYPQHEDKKAAKLAADVAERVEELPGMIRRIVSDKLGPNETKVDMSNLDKPVITVRAKGPAPLDYEGIAERAYEALAGQGKAQDAQVLRTARVFGKMIDDAWKPVHEWIAAGDEVTLEHGPGEGQKLKFFEGMRQRAGDTISEDLYDIMGERWDRNEEKASMLIHEQRVDAFAERLKALEGLPKQISELDRRIGEYPYVVDRKLSSIPSRRPSRLAAFVAAVAIAGTATLAYFGNETKKELQQDTSAAVAALEKKLDAYTAQLATASAPVKEHGKTATEIEQALTDYVDEKVAHLTDENKARKDEIKQVHDYAHGLSTSIGEGLADNNAKLERILNRAEITHIPGKADPVTPFAEKDKIIKKDQETYDKPQTEPTPATYNAQPAAATQTATYDSASSATPTARAAPPRFDLDYMLSNRVSRFDTAQEARINAPQNYSANRFGGNVNALIQYRRLTDAAQSHLEEGTWGTPEAKKELGEAYKGLKEIAPDLMNDVDAQLEGMRRSVLPQTQNNNDKDNEQKKPQSRKRRIS